MENAADVARSMWTMFEPVHAVTYFALRRARPSSRLACADSGAAISLAGRRRSAPSRRRR